MPAAQSDKRAAECYAQAAQQGLPAAQHKLAMMYEHGKGVPQDNMTACKWYLLASKNGHEPSSQRLNAMTRQMSQAQIQQIEQMTRDHSDDNAKTQNQQIAASGLNSDTCY